MMIWIGMVQCLIGPELVRRGLMRARTGRVACLWCAASILNALTAALLFWIGAKQ